MIENEVIEGEGNTSSHCEKLKNDEKNTLALLYKWNQNFNEEKFKSKKSILNIKNGILLETVKIAKSLLKKNLGLVESASKDGLLGCGIGFKIAHMLEEDPKRKKECLEKNFPDFINLMVELRKCKKSFFDTLKCIKSVFSKKWRREN